MFILAYGALCKCHGCRAVHSFIQGFGDRRSLMFKRFRSSQDKNQGWGAKWLRWLLYTMQAQLYSIRPLSRESRYGFWGAHHLLEEKEDIMISEGAKHSKRTGRRRTESITSRRLSRRTMGLSYQCHEKDDLMFRYRILKQILHLRYRREPDKEYLLHAFLWYISVVLGDSPRMQAVRHSIKSLWMSFSIPHPWSCHLLKTSLIHKSWNQTVSMKTPPSL